MASFPTIGKAPGVYIQEITLPGPIAGVSTSIAAFVGPAQMGPLRTPTFLTNFQEFQNIFGSYLEDPYRVYVTHAVNGFFAEGGGSCYFVRVGTGAQATLNLLDRSTKNRATLVVTALKEGAAGNGITATVADANIASTNAARATANIAAGKAPVNQNTIGTALAADAANFNPGDWVLLTSGANTQRVAISSITKDTVANTTTFTVVSNLTNDFGGGTIRVADLIPGQTRFRVASATGLEPGSYVVITQGAVTESAVVSVVDHTNNFLTVTHVLANTYTNGGADPAVTVVSQEFTLTITAPGNPVETFTNLSLDPRHSHYFQNVAASASVSVGFADPPTVTLPANNLPVALAATHLGAVGQGIAGADDHPENLLTSDYHTAIDTLRKVDNVNLLCVPDAAGSHFHVPDTQDIQAYMIAHCERMQDRFAILDCAEMLPTTQTFDAVINQRQNLNSNNGYGALYFPWIMISNPFGSGQIAVPPSGHTAGVYANNDNNFGVFKAPANEPITSALAVEVPMSDGDQGPLNDLGINVIRSFTGQGIVIWGARTIAPTTITAWRFVNVRRLLTFIEKSIQKGTRFAVFEPNNLTLWQQLKRLVTDFLTTQWSEGALFGDTPDKAFRVRVDETLNTPQITALGQLIVQVTVRPTTPAEFIIFQVIQDPTGATLSESTT
jgi:uncharacterized protein